MKAKLNVLVVDDDDDDVFLTCDYLSAIDTFEIVIDKEMNYQKAYNKIVENKHDVYLVDYLLGPYTGIQLIEQCRVAGNDKPFILLTGNGDRRIDIEATNVGAYDYITKSELNTESLERSLRYSMQRYASLVAITESENKYRQIFTKSTDIILVFDDTFRIINFNPIITSLLGYLPSELLNQPLIHFFENEEAGLSFIKNVETGEIKNDTEIVLLTKNGERKTFLSSCTRINSPDGVPQYQGIFYDYTQIKKSYEEQLLKEKIEATEKLVRTLAHEIRNPLTSINLSVYQLENELEKEEQIYTDIIKRSSNRINELIKELMFLSDPVDKEDEKIDVNDLVKSVLNLATDRIKLKGIIVCENYTQEQSYIIGDVKKLEMALLNIVINAIEAMGESKGKLLLETSISKLYATIRITDNGSGISPENLSGLFQPYFTGKKNGIGLGLATTHSFIQAHQGTVDVISELGKGTTFVVKLKLAKELN